MKSFLLLLVLTALGLSGGRAEGFSSAAESNAALRKGEFQVDPKWAGIHPRLLVDPEGLKADIAEWKANPDLYAPLCDQGTFAKQPPSPLQAKMAGWDFTKEIYLSAVLYVVTGDEAALDRVHKWIVGGYKPGYVDQPDPIVIVRLGLQNKDLAAGGFLVTTALTYDLLAGSEAFHARYPGDLDILEQALRVQAAETYKDLSSLDAPWYEQNHFYIVGAGLGLTAMALWDKRDEIPEIASWAVFARNAMERSKRVLSSDGFYYESVGYWDGFFYYATSYAEALKRLTGEDWLTPKPGAEASLLTGLDQYLAQMMLPAPGKTFGYGDSGPRKPWTGYKEPFGSLTLPLSFTCPLQLAEYAPSPLVPFIVATQWEDQKTYKKTYVNQMDAGLTLLKLPLLKKNLAIDPKIAAMPPYYYFPDHEVVSWHSAWLRPAAAEGTALYYKCGPPEGHLAGTYIAQYPDWKPGMGHVHPDAASFTLFAKGSFLASDPGYVGIKKTAYHNCLLIDGKGQYREGTVWDNFDAAHYPKYDKLHLEDVWLAGPVAAATAVADSAYDDALQLSCYRRRLILVGGRWLVTRDTVAAPAAHTYTWTLNSETPFQADGSAANHWTTESPTARLVVQSLVPLAKSELAPTEVDVDPDGGGEKAEREQHLSQELAPAAEGTFFNALSIQDPKADPKSFTAVADGKEGVAIGEGKDRCLILLGTEERLDGQYGYAWTHDGQLQSFGFEGARLLLPDGRIATLDVLGKVAVSRKGDGWTVESDLPKAAVLKIDGKGKAATVALPAGNASTPFSI